MAFEGSKPPKIFISHGKHDAWVASQIALRVRSCGPSTFLDETDILKGDDFKKRIHEEITCCSELIVLLTPWSANRNWVWIEVGAAWCLGKRVVAVLYGITVDDLEKLGGSKAILEDINLVELNDFDSYLKELSDRCEGRLK